MEYTQQINITMKSKHSNAITKICKKYDIKRSKMIRMFIDYFTDNPTELEKLVERYP